MQMRTFITNNDALHYLKFNVYVIKKERKKKNFVINIFLSISILRVIYTCQHCSNILYF